MRQPVWVELEEVLAIHDRQIAEHGGRSGIRDRGLLESALQRPKNLLHFSAETPGLPRLAGAYAIGICRNHPFFDGNKRVALVVCLLFLELNGMTLNAPLEEEYAIFDGLAAGTIKEKRLAQWLAAYVEKV